STRCSPRTSRRAARPVHRSPRCTGRRAPTSAPPRRAAIAARACDRCAGAPRIWNAIPTWPMQRCSVAKAKQIKLFLHHRYDHVESGPAEVVGAHGKQQLARLLFIPFEYATPTYGDVVVAARDPEFERNWAFEVLGPGGMPESKLHEWGGRYAMAVR